MCFAVVALGSAVHKIRHRVALELMGAGKRRNAHAVVAQPLASLFGSSEGDDSLSGADGFAVRHARAIA